MSTSRTGAPRHVPAPDLAAALAELGTIALGTQPLTEVLSRVAAVAAGAVTAADEVSVTVMDQHGRPGTVAFSGHRSVLLDERQYEDGAGPCLDAAATGTVVSIEDTATDRTYPAFSAVCHHHGVRHVFAVGLSGPRRVAGALNFYSTGDRPFDDRARTSAALFAGPAAVFIANAAAYEQSVDLADHLRRAMASRAVIEQAKGIVMAGSGCTPEEAFNTLVAMSSRSNVKLREVAQRLVEETQKRR